MGMRLLFAFGISVQQGVHILVVDDEASVRLCMKLLLERDGHEVCAVDGGEAALAQLAQRKFDLVITDFSMPGMDGDELVTRIREINPDQPIIMCTAFVEEYKIFGEGSVHVDALLLKPFPFEELRECIEQVLNDGHRDGKSVIPLEIDPPPPQDFIPPPEP